MRKKACSLNTPDRKVKNIVKTVPVRFIGGLLIFGNLGIMLYWFKMEWPNPRYVFATGICFAVLGVFLLWPEIIGRISILKGLVDIESIRRKAKAGGEEIDRLREEAEKRLGEIDERLSELDLLTRFQDVVSQAQNDERQAFDQLKKWADDPSFPMSSRAAQAWYSVRDTVLRTLVYTVSPFRWPNGVDPEILTMEKCGKVYKSQSCRPAWFKKGFLCYVWRRETFPKKERMQFLVDVMKDEQSLEATATAGDMLRDEGKFEFHQLAVEAIMKWWEENKENF